MESIQERYKIGDWIVHVDYGLGQIIGQDQKLLAGEERKFLRVETADSLYWILVTNIDTDRIRPIASKNQFRYALDLIRKAPKKLSKSYLNRRKEIIKMLKDVSLYSKVRLIRDLSGRSSTKFSSFDNNVLISIKEQFLNEWTLVMEEDQKNLVLILKDALNASSQKV